jgi:hypothetical protein
MVEVLWKDTGGSWLLTIELCTGKSYHKPGLQSFQELIETKEGKVLKKRSTQCKSLVP